MQLFLKRFKPFIEILAIFLSGWYRACYLLFPAYKYVYYDEAIPGLMTLQMLKGNFPFFYWGAPYLGSIESLVAVPFFIIFESSTFALRLSPLVAFLFFGYFFLKLGQKILGERWAVCLIVYLWLPPLALSEYALSPIGGYMHTVAMGSFLLFFTAKMLERPKNSLMEWGILGVVSGVGFWNFMMILPYIAACYFILILKEKKHCLGYLLFSSAAFLLGSLPLWVWNIKNNWMTFTMKGGIAPVSDLFGNILRYYRVILSVMGISEEFAHSGFSSFLSVILATGLFLAFIALFRKIKEFVKMLTGRMEPDALLLILITFLFTAGSYIFSVHGAQSITRYGLPAVSTLPILVFWGIKKTVNKKFLVFLFIVLLHSPHHFSFFLKQNEMGKNDYLSQVISFLEGEQIHFAYAHYTVSQPITFESKEKIICSDFSGFRNIEYLKRVDLASRVAIITHKTLRIPDPLMMEENLNLIVLGFRKKEIGEYVVFYDFQVPSINGACVTNQIKSIKNHEGEEISSFLTDGIISSCWTSREPQSENQKIDIELKEIVPVSGISLFPGLNVNNFPRGIRLDVSKDGNEWETVKSDSRIVESFLPFGDHPKMFGQGQIDLYFPSVVTRFLRLQLTEQDNSFWSIGEVVLSRDRNFYDETVWTVLDEIFPEISGYLVTYPWIQAMLEQKSKKINSYSPLYPERLKYQVVYRYDDFDLKTLDNSKPLCFLVFSEEKDRIIEMLNVARISYTLQERVPYCLIKTTPKAKVLKEKSRVLCDFRLKKYSGKPYVEVDLNPIHSINGISLISDLRTQQPLNLKSEILIKGIWKPLDMILETGLYWSGQSLLNIQNYQMNWAFAETVSGERLRFLIESHSLPFWSATDIFLFFNDENPSSTPVSFSSPSQEVFFDKKIMLKQFQINTDWNPGGVVEMKFVWETLKKVPNDFYVFIHFYDSNNRILFQNDYQIQRFQTTVFSPKQLIIDREFITIPGDFKNRGAVYCGLGLWDPLKKRRYRAKSSLRIEDRRIELKKWELDQEKENKS